MKNLVPSVLSSLLFITFAHPMEENSLIPDSVPTLYTYATKAAFLRPQDPQKLAALPEELQTHIINEYHQQEGWPRAHYTTIAPHGAHTSWANCTAIAPDMTRIAFGTDHGQIHIHNLNTDQQQHIYDQDLDLIRTIAWSSDGSFIASGDNNHMIFLWNSLTRTIVRQWMAHGKPILSLEFADQAKKIFSSSYDNHIRMWALNKKNHIAQLDGHTKQISSIRLSPEETNLVSGSWDGSIAVWDIETRTIVRRFLLAFPCMVNAVAYCMPSTIVSGDSSGAVRIWDAREQDCARIVHSTGKAITSVSCSPDKRTIASKSLDGKAYLWDLLTNRMLATLKTRIQSTATVTNSDRALTFSANGTLLAVAHDLVHLWRMADLQETPLPLLT